MSVHPSLHVYRRVKDYSHVFRESRETVFTISRCVDIVIHASGYEDTGPDSIPSSKSKATDPFHTLYHIGHVALASIFFTDQSALRGCCGQYIAVFIFPGLSWNLF